MIAWFIDLLTDLLIDWLIGVVNWSLDIITDDGYSNEGCAPCSLCSFLMMVKWAYDGLLQANASRMLVNDGEMLVNGVNDGDMSAWYYTNFFGF